VKHSLANKGCFFVWNELNICKKKANNNKLKNVENSILAKKKCEKNVKKLSKPKKHILLGVKGHLLNSKRSQGYNNIRMDQF
jgi:hypothetical protein